LDGRLSRHRFGESESVAVVKRLLMNRKGAIGTGILVLVVLMALFGPRFAPYDAIELHLDDQLAEPSRQYWFGTDELGRDILSRIIVGAAISLEAGLLAVTLAAIVGIVTGLTAGYLGGGFDSVIMRIWDTVLAFPAIFLAIGIVTILGAGRSNATLAIAIINMPAFARLIRATTLSVKGNEFVDAARLLGATDLRIMFKTIFPNCITPLMVQMAISVPSAIIIEAALSFLGLGSQPPAPSWGNMLSAAQSYLHQAPTYGIFPGVAISLTVIGMNYFADGLQDAVDARRIYATSKMG
jgi:ABC-type dipeptide/oligopeptide/nickel transport system permease subunit